jgi:hypothetical protein
MLWKRRRVKDSWYLSEGVVDGRGCPLMGLAFLVPLWDSTDRIKRSDDIWLNDQSLLRKAGL